MICPSLRLILIRKVAILFESYFSTFGSHFSTFWIAFLYFLDCILVLFGLSHFGTFWNVVFWYFLERRILVLFGSHFRTFLIAFWYFLNADRNFLILGFLQIFGMADSIILPPKVFSLCGLLQAEYKIWPSSLNGLNSSSDFSHLTWFMYHAQTY